MMSIQKEEEQKQFCLQLKDIRDYKFTNTELAFYYLYKIIGHCKMNLKIEKKIMLCVMDYSLHAHYI